MKNQRWLATCVALALAGLMLWAEASFAQGRGDGPRGRASQSYQGGWQGQGPNYQNCPNYPAYQNCRRGQGNYPQGRRGFRQGGRANQANQPNSPSNPPAVNQ